jgi:hypothetical protein
MIQKYDYFSRWNTKSSHFEKFIFIQQLLTQDMRYIRKTICIFNNKLQKNSFKKMKKTLKRFTILL